MGYLSWNFSYMERLYLGMIMLDEHMIDTLLDCSLFKGMGAEEISAVLSDSSGRIRSYPRDTLIAQAGDEVLHLQIVLEGSVKGEMIDYSGKVIKIEDIDPPRPLAPAFLFGFQNRYPVNITAGGDVKVLSIPRERFLEILQNSKSVLVNFVDIISNRGQFLSSKIKFLSFSTIKGKLAQYLLDLSGKAGSLTFALSSSQAQLSELFGVARPSIGRAMSELNHDEIIRTVGREVTILDPAALSRLLK
jgi:CRP-like cAMP-binding protein